MNRNVAYVIGGGTMSYVRAHLALCAPAFGNTATQLFHMLQEELNPSDWKVQLVLTKMADQSSKIITTSDLEHFVDTIISDPHTRIVVMNAAVADFDGTIGDVPSGRYAERMQSSVGEATMQLTAANKILSRIRKERKDIFLVGFKTTAGASKEEQYASAILRLKQSSANLFFANDIVNRTNMIVVPEESHYASAMTRDQALHILAQVIAARTKLTFTRSTVVPGELIKWTDANIPHSLRTVVDYCISRGAYRKVNGVTAGHFAVKHTSDQFITSIRKTDFNHLSSTGMVLVTSTGRDSVIAQGAKPSVGGQSQRIIFNEHDDVDCIVHFHCPLQAGSSVPVRLQWMYECGSHECGQNTSDGLRELAPGIKAVYLDKHGPNVVFHRSMDPSRVIRFIESNFNLNAKTDHF